MKTRIMFIENKSEGLIGDARIGRVKFSKTMKLIQLISLAYKLTKNEVEKIIASRKEYEKI